MRIPKRKLDHSHLADAVAISKSRNEVLGRVGLPKGSTYGYKILNYYCTLYNIDISHLNGREATTSHIKIPLDEILEGLHPFYPTSHLKRRLLVSGWKHECNICSNTQWNEQPIPLELDHIDGDPTNHRRENLRLICPNCHAQTPTHAGKNAKHVKRDRSEYNEKALTARLEALEARKRLILESGIDFNVYGYGTQLATLLGMTPQCAMRWIKKQMPELVSGI